MLLLMSITVHIPFVTQNTKPDNLIRKTRNKMDFIGLLGLLQTVRGKQGQAITGNKDRGTSIRKTFMDYRQTKYIVKYCQELFYGL